MYRLGATCSNTHFQFQQPTTNHDSILKRLNFFWLFNSHRHFCAKTDNFSNFVFYAQSCPPCRRLCDSSPFVRFARVTCDVTFRCDIWCDIPVRQRTTDILPPSRSKLPLRASQTVIWVCRAGCETDSKTNGRRIASSPHRKSCRHWDSRQIAQTLWPDCDVPLIMRQALRHIYPLAAAPDTPHPHRYPPRPLTVPFWPLRGQRTNRRRCPTHALVGTIKRLLIGQNVAALRRNQIVN